MSLHDKVISFESKHRIKELDSKIGDGYLILDKLKDAGQGQGPLAKTVRDRLAELNKQRAEIWLASSQEVISSFLTDDPK